MTLSAVFALVASHLSNFVDGFLKVIKMVVIIIVALAFYAAIKTLLTLLGTIVSSSVIGEVFGLASMFLPFNASAVFSSIGSVISGILTFLIARKIFNLYKEVFAAV